MQARLKNPALLLPDAMKPAMELAAVAKNGLPEKLLNLVHLRASQINGCAVCLDGHARHAKKAGETDERMFTLAAWREAPWFTDAERAALALTEAATRMADRGAEAVSDEVWNEAARHFDEPALAALVLNIALINLWNRINVTTRQIAGSTSW
ncbi:MAG TPA: carboxymuconolactone decarboxylase family protein [Polyangia bacterium]|jgi:AhpD family alkylhydroperoxidase